MDVHPSAQFPSRAAGRHSIDHLLDQDRRVRTDDVETQDRFTLRVNHRLGKTLLLHQRHPIRHIVIAGPSHQDLVIPLRCRLGQADGRDLWMGEHRVRRGVVDHRNLVRVVVVVIVTMVVVRVRITVALLAVAISCAALSLVITSG